MSLVKKIARHIILPGALFLKAYRYLLKKNTKSCCIINFHGVRKHSSEVFNNRHIPVDEFEKIIKYLSSNYSIVPLSELFAIHKEKKKVNQKTIALTFDDGYLNNFEIAFPVLKKYNTPATFYIIGKGLTDNSFIVWPDAIDLVKKFNKTDIEVDGHTFKSPTYYSENINSEVINYLKTTGKEAENLTLKFFNGPAKNSVKTQSELLKLVDKETLRKFANEPLLEFGSHTHTHFCLEYLEKQTLKEELLQSKKIIENITEKKVISLAFPDGSYNMETLSVAKECGYTNLVAVDYKFDENNKNPNLLSRFTISNSTTFESNVLRLAKEFQKFGF